MIISLTDKQQTKLVLVLGKNTNIPPVWTLSDPSVASIDVAGDGLSGTVTALTVGTSALSIRTNCDLGSGFCEQVTALTIEVGSKPPVVGIYAAIPVDKPVVQVQYDVPPAPPAI